MGRARKHRHRRHAAVPWLVGLLIAALLCLAAAKPAAAGTGHEVRCAIAAAVPFAAS